MSPLRPWEYWQVDAEEWTEAQAVHAMYRQGLEDARDEHQANQELTKGKPS